MSLFETFLETFEVSDPDAPLSESDSAMIRRSKLEGNLERLIKAKADYYTKGSAQIARVQAQKISTQIEGLKVIKSIESDIVKVASQDRRVAMTSAARATDKMGQRVRRIETQIEPARGKLAILQQRSGQTKTASNALGEIAGSGFFDEGGIRASDEKIHATLKLLGEQGRLFTIGPDGQLSSDTVAAGSSALKNAQTLYNETAFAYERKVAEKRNLESGVKILQDEMVRLNADDSAAFNQGKLREVSGVVASILTTLPDEESLKTSRDSFLKEDAALGDLDLAIDRIRSELSRAKTKKSKLAAIIGSPRFQLWAEMHGHKVGTFTEFDEDGKPVLSSYVPNILDEGIVLHFGLQQRTGLDLTLDRRGRLVSFKADDVMVDPLDSFDLDDETREAKRALRAGFSASKLDPFSLPNFGGTFYRVDGSDPPKVYAQLDSGALDELSTDLAQKAVGLFDALIPAEQSKRRVGAAKTAVGLKAELDRLSVRPSGADDPGTYRELKPNTRDLKRGVIKLQSTETGEIIEVPVEGYRESIEIIEALPSDFGDFVRSRRDERLARRGRRRVSPLIEDEDSTGRELASARRREGEGGLQDQLDEAREELKLAKALDASEGLVSDMRDTREDANRVLRAQRAVEQLDAKIGGALTESGTRVEEAVGDEPALDPVPVFGTGESQLKQEDGKPIETGAELLEASARQLVEPVPEGERPESPVADTLIKAEDVQPTTTGIAARTKAANKTGTRDPSYQTNLQQFRQRLRQLRSGSDNKIPEENIDLRGSERRENQESRGEATVTSPERLNYRRDFPNLLKGAKGEPVLTPADIEELRDLGVTLEVDQFGRSVRSGSRPAPYLEQGFVPQPRLTPEVYSRLRTRKTADDGDDDIQLKEEPKIVSPYDDEPLEFGRSEDDTQKGRAEAARRMALVKKLKRTMTADKLREERESAAKTTGNSTATANGGG